MAALAATACGFTACSNNDEPGGSDTTTPLTPPVKIELSAAERTSVADINALGARMFAELYDATESTPAFSPLSAQMAMALTANGATGETLDEMLAVLCPGGTLADLNSLCKKLQETLPVTDASTTLSMANSVWHCDDITLLQPFTTFAADNYNAPTAAFDKSTPAAAAALVNGWISDNTGGMIRDMLDESDFESDILLINALYFKSIWSQKFSKNNTKKEKFTNVDGSTNKVNMMNAQLENAKYAELNGTKLASLSFGNGAFFMNLALPAEGKTPADAMQILAGQSIGWLNTKLNIKLPRFSAETTMELQDIYQSLGMSRPFSSEAQFDAMCDIPEYIGKIKQNCRLDVDETGAEGAATTVVELLAWSNGMGSVPPEIEFTLHLNRAFAYTISEASTGAILFMGAVNKM